MVQAFWEHEVQKGKSTGRPRVNNDTVNQIKHAFENNPVMSTNHASRQLGIPQSTIWKVLRKTLKMKSYYVYSVHQELKPEDKLARLNFCLSLQEKIAQNDDINGRLVFSDEACFHISGKVNRHNIRIWGTQSPHEIMECARDSLKVNVFCVISHR